MLKSLILAENVTRQSKRLSHTRQLTLFVFTSILFLNPLNVKRNTEVLKGQMSKINLNARRRLRGHVGHSRVPNRWSVSGYISKLPVPHLSFSLNTQSSEFKRMAKEVMACEMQQ